MQENNTTQKNIRQKLFEIQLNVASFEKTEESGTTTNKKPEYKYTPGWVISEAIRKEMNRLGLMLERKIESESNQFVSRIIYKEIGKEIIPFKKESIMAKVVCEYIWRDVTTGETTEPIKVTTYGDNGTDKSLSSALALNRRIFLLDYFTLSTKDCEPDAIDSDSITGIDGHYSTLKQKSSLSGMQMRQSEQQAFTAPAPEAAPAPAYVPESEKAQPQTFGSTQNNSGAQNINQQIYETAVSDLMNYNAGTQSHNEKMQKWLKILNEVGYTTAKPFFAFNLQETAQARREGRAPMLKKMPQQ